MVFERKTLRKIFGAVKIVQVWTNQKLKDLFKEPDMIQSMKLNRMRWTGYVARKWLLR